MARSDHSSEIAWQTWPVDLGRALLAWSPHGLCAVFVADDDAALQAELARSFPGRASRRAEVVPTWADGVLAALNGQATDPAPWRDVPLDVQGTAFQHMVWAALRHIPCGQTVSYTELAHRVGRPQAVRAVASACAANVLAVLTPCHRVVRRDGSLSGYRWGLARKQLLLNREAAR